MRQLDYHTQRGYLFNKALILKVITMKKLDIAWPVIEILTSTFLSFFGSILFSLFVWMTLLQVEGEGGPGDGIGFIIVLFFIIPVWMIFLLIGTYYSNVKFKSERDGLKRVEFSSILPIIITTMISGILTITLLK